MSARIALSLLALALLAGTHPVFAADEAPKAAAKDGGDGAKNEELKLPATTAVWCTDLSAGNGGRR